MRYMTGIRRALIAFAAFASPVFAATYSLDLKPESTKVQWTLGDVLHTVRGTFRFVRGTIEFDTTTGKASGQVVVSVVSGESGDKMRDGRMHANVLESGKYPEAVFSPTSVEGTLAVPGASSVKVRGTLSIHGASHDVTMDVKATAEADQLHAAMTFSIPYVAWGMKDPSNFLLKVNKAVDIAIETAGPLQKR